MTTKHTDENARDQAKTAAVKQSAKEKADDAATSNEPINKDAVEGEYVLQNKPNMAEGMAHAGVNASIKDVGKGSLTEEAPAVRSAGEGIADPDRVVQQGDEVIVHGRAIIDGLTSARGLVLKINQDSTIAVRIPRGNGQTHDVTQVKNYDAGDGSFWWSWPEVDTLKKDIEESERDHVEAKADHKHVKAK